MDILNNTDIGFLGRTQNGVVLKYNKQIIISTDILKIDGKDREPHISLDHIEEKIDLFASQILLDGKNSKRDSEPIVYGEALVDLLKWIIGTLKTHKHPPNAIAIPDFHPEANSRLSNMEDDLLNKRVQTR